GGGPHGRARRQSLEQRHGRSASIPAAARGGRAGGWRQRIGTGRRVGGAARRGPWRGRCRGPVAGQSGANLWGGPATGVGRASARNAASQEQGEPVRGVRGGDGSDPGSAARPGGRGRLLAAAGPGTSGGPPRGGPASAGHSAASQRRNQAETAVG